MMYFMVYTNVWENHYLMLLPIVTFLYHKHSSIWLLISWFLLAIPPRHLGYSQLLPNWDIAFIRPISALILFGICIYLMVWKTDKVKVKETSVHMDPDPEPLTVN